MILNSKEWLSNEKNISLLLNILGMAVFAYWLFWYFGVGFRPIKIEQPETAQPPINIDKASYDLTDKYLGSVKNFVLPEFNYDNPEPFREYR